jgi:hypothetical protein
LRQERVAVRLKPTVLAGLLLILVGVAGLGYALDKIFVFSNNGNVYTTGVEVYWNANKTGLVTLIDWGFMYGGASNTKTLYLYNPGNLAVTLDKTVTNVNPANFSDYMTLEWTPDVTYLESKLVTQANLTLTIDPTIGNTTIDAFSFDIVITAYET